MANISMNSEASRAPEIQHEKVQQKSAYARSLARAGFGDEVETVQTAYANGDRAGAVAGVSDRMLDAISIVGDEKLVARAVAAYREAGVDVPVVFPVLPRNGRAEAVESRLRPAGHRQHG